MPISGTRHLSIGGGVARAIKFQPDANCVLWTPGQDDPQSAVLRDRSGQVNNGAITSATWVRSDKGLWCLSFDGTDDVVSFPAKDYSATNGTIEFWMNPQEWTDYPCIIDDWPIGTSPTNYFLFIRHGSADANEGKLQFTINDGGGEDSAFSTTTPIVGTWYHIVGTWGAAGMVLYLDGVAEGTNANTGEWTPTEVLTIGTFVLDQAIRYYQGYLALLRIYSRALPLSEVQSHYRQERALVGA